MADPGRGCANLETRRGSSYYLAKFSRKLHENEEMLRPLSPTRSANAGAPTWVLEPPHLGNPGYASAVANDVILLLSNSEQEKLKQFACKSILKNQP